MGFIKDNNKNFKHDDKYKMVLDSIDEGYCIIQMIYNDLGQAVDWRYLEVNPAFELNNGLYDAPGRTIREMAPDIEPKWIAIYDKIAQTGEPLRFREDSTALKRVFNLYAFRVGNPDDRLVAVIFTDITEQAKAEQTLKASEEKQAFLLKLSDSLRFTANPVTIQLQAARILGQYLKANRVGYAETLPDEDKVAVTLHYTDNAIDIKGVYSYKEYGFNLFDRLKRGATITISDVVNDPLLSEAEKKAYSGLDIAATLNVPLVKEERLVAIMFVQYTVVHTWTENEIALAEETAERTWAAVERAKTEEALKQTEKKYREQLQLEVEERTAQLKDSRDLLQATLNHSYEQNKELNTAQRLGRIGNFFFDLDNDSVTWSEQLYDIMGFPYDTTLNFEKAISVYVEPGRQKLIKKTMESLKTGVGFEIETKFIPFGETEERYIKIRTEVSTNAEGQKTGVKGVVQDITDIKKAELEIKELNKTLRLKNRELEAMNSELTTFNNIAANYYHETFRALYLNLENLIKSDAARLSNTGKANLRKAQSAIQKMKMLTEDIVSFSRLPDLGSVTDKIDLNEVLKTILDDFKEKINFSNTNISAENLPVIEGYPLLVSLLFYHLLDNAIKFRKEDEDLTIEIKSEIVTQPFPAENQSLTYHAITFTDNGIGISPDEADNIFKIFYRLHERGKYKGSGIGLAVCRKIMALHNGYVYASPASLKGTVVTCLFPV